MTRLTVAVLRTPATIVAVAVAIKLPAVIDAHRLLCAIAVAGVCSRGAAGKLGSRSTVVALAVILGQAITVATVVTIGSRGARRVVSPWPTVVTLPIKRPVAAVCAALVAALGAQSDDVVTHSTRVSARRCDLRAVCLPT